MGKVKLLSTSYMREGYIFECYGEFFGKLSIILNKAETIEDAIKKVKETFIRGEPLCRNIYKVTEYGKDDT